jgi:hypothetical protein
MTVMAQSVDPTRSDKAENVGDQNHKVKSAHLKQVVDLVADAFVEGMVAGFSYGVEIRAQIYVDLEVLIGFWQRDDDEAA